MKTTPVPVRWLLVVPALLLSLDTRAVAQSAVAAENKKEEITEFAPLVVTGSNIPAAADAMAVPGGVLGPKDIAQTGLNSNPVRSLRTRIPAFACRSNAGNSRT